MVRLGRQLRALRRRRGWRQVDVAEAAGVSQTVISLVERGHGDRLSVATLREMTRALEARLEVSVSWRAGDLDRAVDARHAALAGFVAALLRACGWDVRAEVTYAIDGERGSIDLLAWHAESRTLLVIEIKTELASIEATLRAHDTKARLARVVAGRFGWRPASVSRLLVLQETSTNRRRLGEVRRLLGPTFISDGWGVRRWLQHPTGTLDGGWVLSGSNPGAGKQPGGGFHRVRVPRSPVAHAQTAAQGTSRKAQQSLTSTASTE